MRTVVGVDLGGQYEPALNLCLDIDFPEQEIVFVHAVEPMPEYAPPMDSGILDSAHWMKHLREAGKQALLNAANKARARGVEVHALEVDGSPAANLMHTAEARGADLIAVGSTQEGALREMFLGSVAKGLATGAKQSVLVVKSESTPTAPLSALFATDYSDYANRALQKLLAWAPKGLKRIDVVTAYKDSEEAFRQLHENVAGDEETIVRHLREKAGSVCGTISAAGYESSCHVEKGHPNDVLPHAMQSMGADILVLGAQGHGFLERLLIGSVSLHQVAAEPYPVLLIRA